MISIILAGGYAKRLWPLTKEIAKPLLPIGNKVIIDFIMEKLMELNAVDKIIVSANLRFRNDFEKWARRYSGKNVRIVFDKSFREEEKPGAVKALAEITSGLSDDCLVIAGDNIFTNSLKGMIEEYESRAAPMIALYDVKNLELAKHYATVEVDSDGKIVSFEEKPTDPETTLISTCIYLFPAGVLPRIREYVDSGLEADEPGRFIGWLSEREPVFGYFLDGEWYDIGTPSVYSTVLKRFSANE